MSCADKNRPGA
uniref:Uncharacterized protein n=1 Tax=Anguilla anguilla TaxID=7936 RepID=A0A0E9W3D2_ANGAN